MATGTRFISGLVMDENVTLTLGELSRSCGVSAEWVIELVDEGVLQPLGRHPSEWRFQGDALRRAQTALRLVQDLRLNLAGAALALELLDEIEELRCQVRRGEP